MPGWFGRHKRTLPEVARKNIESIGQIEQEFQRRDSAVDRLSDRISRFAGSTPFLIAHVIWFGVWMALNTVWLVPDLALDPYPFVFLNLLVALEAVFLSTFVLMSQNRQNRQAEHWAHLHLQVGLLAEQESTKMLQMLQTISQRLGLNQTSHDPELKEMIEKTHVEVLAAELHKARQPEQPVVP